MHHATYRGSGGIALRILNLGTRLGLWSASLLRRFTFGVRGPTYLLEKRLNGAWNQSGRGGEQKKSHNYPDRSAHSLVPILTELPRRLMSQCTYTCVLLPGYEMGSIEALAGSMCHS